MLIGRFVLCAILLVAVASLVSVGPNAQAGEIALKSNLVLQMDNQTVVVPTAPQTESIAPIISTESVPTVSTVASESNPTSLTSQEMPSPTTVVVVSPAESESVTASLAPISTESQTISVQTSSATSESIVSSIINSVTTLLTPTTESSAASTQLSASSLSTSETSQDSTSSSSFEITTGETPVTTIVSTSSTTEWSHTEWSHTEWSHTWGSHSQWQGGNPYWCYQSYQYYCYPGYQGYYGYYYGYPYYPGYQGYASQTVTTVTYSSYVTAGASSTNTFSLTPIAGTTVHDVSITITPLQGGEFSVFLSAQGLQPGGVYLVEGITGETQIGTQPFGSSMAASVFLADSQGNGIYSYVSTTNPQSEYTGASLLYLPTNQITNSILVATGPLA